MIKLWADRYVEIRRTAEDAIRLIKPGNRVFVGSPRGIPRHLVRELFKAARQLSDVELVSLLAPESVPFGFVADESIDQIFNLRSFYPGSIQHEALRRKTRFITPINLSAAPNLFKSRAIPVHVALVQVSPPDDFGWMSLGIAVDISLAAVQSADRVIVQVNTEMPRVLGRCSVHVNDVDAVVECDERLLSITVPPEPESAAMIASHTARFVEDGATIQVGLGALHRAIIKGLSKKMTLVSIPGSLRTKSCTCFPQGSLPTVKRDITRESWSPVTPWAVKSCTHLWMITRPLNSIPPIMSTIKTLFPGTAG
jgi:acyl-CoA hydrolase